MSTSSRITAVLARLRGSLGTGEKPPGSNHNFITEWYNKNVSRIGNGPWCEMTVTWAMWTGGAKKLKRGRAYTVYGAQDGANHTNGSSWHVGTKGMRAGDQIYYNWAGGGSRISSIDHTGLVERILGDGTFYVLEGNTSSNRLMRMRRDKKFVVGYVRFDWARLNTTPPPPKAPPKPVVKKASSSVERVKSFQRMLEVTVDGKWDPAMDVVANRVRTAARVKVGYPHKLKAGFSVAHVQNVIDTKIDNDWGPNSQAALVKWVEVFQKIMELTSDGQWGPRTDNAYLKLRKENYRNY